MTRDDREVFRYQVDFGGGDRDVVSLLDSDWVREHGLHPEAVMAVVSGNADESRLLPSWIRENGPFLRLLSRAIFESVDRCGQLCGEAEVQSTGDIFLLDGRAATAGGRVSPEDIVGTVEVRDGKIVANSYRHNVRHRLLTHNGWFRLPVEIEAALQHRLRGRAST